MTKIGLKNVLNKFVHLGGQKQKRGIMFIDNENWNDVISSSLYTPLSKNEEILNCVYKIADLVSNMTIMLMKNDENGDVRIKNELSRKVDINPNPLTTRKQFIFRLVSDMCIYGNSICYPTYEGDYLKKLTVLDMSQVEISENLKDGNYSINYCGRQYYPDEILHFMLYPRSDCFWKGSGILPLLQNTIDNLVQANTTKKAFLKSKWKPSLIISVNSDIESLQNDVGREKILNSYISDTEQGKPWLIPAGELDIKTIQPLTLNDLAIQDSITLDKKTVASAIGVPSFLIGIGEFNLNEYNNFVSTKIMSFANIIQQELTRKLLYSKDLYFKMNIKSLMQYNLTEKMEFVHEMVASGLLSRNEARSEFDYAPVNVDGMNDYNVLENYIPVSELGNQKKLKDGDKNE